MLHKLKQALPKGFFTDLLCCLCYGLFRGFSASIEVLQRLHHYGSVETIGFTQRSEVLRLQIREKQSCMADREGELLILGVECGCDEIVGRRKPQPIPGMEHGKILEVRVGVSSQEADQNAAV